MAVKDIDLEKKVLAKEYKELLKISYQTLSGDDKKLIRKAFNFAVDAHEHQRRISGEAYIFHPIAVAKIVAHEIGSDAISIAAALIHDVVEDNSNYSITLALNNEFTGGGTWYHRQKTLIKAPTGHVCLFPMPTHRHSGRYIDSGTRYIIVSFCNKA